MCISVSCLLLFLASLFLLCQATFLLVVLEENRGKFVRLLLCLLFLELFSHMVLVLRYDPLVAISVLCPATLTTRVGFPPVGHSLLEMALAQNFFLSPLADIGFAADLLRAIFNMMLLALPLPQQLDFVSRHGEAWHGVGAFEDDGFCLL